MAARVSKENRELFRAFMEVLKTSEFLGMSRDDIAGLAEEVDRLVTEKIALPKQVRQPKAEKKEDAAPAAANLPPAPKKKDSKKSDDAEASTEEVTLVEGRRYEAEGNSKLRDAILEYVQMSGDDKAKFQVVSQGKGQVPVGKKVVLPVSVVSPTRRRVKKAA